VFSADSAVEWTQKGKKVILVRRETVPDDIHGMFVAQGIPHGDRRHDVACRAVVGRQMGKPSSSAPADSRLTSTRSGSSRRQDGQRRRLRLVRRPAGRSEDRAGRVEAERDSGRCSTAVSRRKSRHLHAVRADWLSWADKYRTLGVYANADLPDQAELAYAFGARGIGLTRTEHMFFGEGRIPIVQRMILAENRGGSA